MPRQLQSLKTTRREFLAQSAHSLPLAGAAAIAAQHLTTPSNRAMAADTASDKLPIIDTHQHLWDLKLLTLPWLKSDGVQAINRSFVMSDYLQATADLNVVKTVYMEVNVAQSDQRKEAEHVIELCRQNDNPMAAAVIGGYPHDKGFADYIRPLAKHSEIKGVRTVLHDPDRPTGLCLTDEFVKGIRLLGELGLSFDLCMRPDEVLDGVALAKKCPDTRFIVDHCGNMSVTSQDKHLRKKWSRGIREAAQQDNMFCKISGIVVTAEADSWEPRDLAPNINTCLKHFGDDRVFFGGDWPVCTLKATFGQWTDALKTIVRKRSPEFKQKLFHDNAERIYGLS